MKKGLLFLLTIILCICNQPVKAQYGKGYKVSHIVIGKDTIMNIEFEPIFIFSKKLKSRFYANESRLSYAIFICYPIAQDAQYQLYIMKETLKKMHTEKEKKDYINSVEKSLIRKYTPVLKKMSFYQGAILLKLIDRQTGSTGYTILKELKSGMSAFFWQTIARLYGANLKVQYDKNKVDKILETYVLLYEEQFLPKDNRDRINEIPI